MPQQLQPPLLALLTVLPQLLPLVSGPLPSYSLVLIAYNHKEPLVITHSPSDSVIPARP